MADFSYNSDISPLKGSYFSDVSRSTNLSDREKSFLTEKYGTAINASLDSQIKSISGVIKFQQEQRQADLEFKRAQLALDETRRKIQNEMEMEQVLPKIEPLLTGLMNNKEIDSATAIAEGEKLRLQFSPYTLKNPALNSVFDNFVKGVNTRNANSTIITNLAAKAAEDGDVKAAEDILRSKDPNSAITRLAQSQAEINKQAGSLKQQEEAGKTFRAQNKAQLSVLNSQLDTILKMKPESLTTPTQSDGAFGSSAAENKGPSFTKQQKDTLEIILKKMNPSMRNKDFSGVSPEDMYNDTLEGTYLKIDELTGGTPQSTIFKKSE
jgi:hypothetical protein